MARMLSKSKSKCFLKIFRQMVQEGDEVVIVDDLLATGGTLKGVIDLLKGQGAKIAKILLLV